MDELQFQNEGFETVDETEPARPEKLSVDFLEDGENLVIHKRRGGGPVFFLMLWLTGWTVGCVFLLVEIVKEPAIGMLAFAIPFWASWLFVAGLIVWMLFGKETLVIGRDQAFFQKKAIVVLSSRSVPRKEIQGARPCQSSYQENDRYLWGIELVTVGLPLQFCFRLPDNERAWLIHQLNRFLGTLDFDRTASSTEPEFTQAKPVFTKWGTARKTPKPTITERLAREATHEEPPNDCRWYLGEGFDAFQIMRPGLWHWGALGGLLFINAFWNGIVSVFVMILFGFMPGDQPHGWEWWGLFFFLIPFEVIGLVMFLGLLRTAIDPFVRTVWQFNSDRIVRQIRWPLFSRNRSWEIIGPHRLELRKKNKWSSQDSNNRGMEMTPGASFELAFINDANADICTIDELTEGEARWIAHLLFERRPTWFPAHH
ncbi:MAG: hypothetical protein U1D30_03500 [Planctomycetota bacterium]